MFSLTFFCDYFVRKHHPCEKGLSQNFPEWFKYRRQIPLACQRSPLWGFTFTGAQ